MNRSVSSITAGQAQLILLFSRSIITHHQLQTINHCSSFYHYFTIGYYQPHMFIGWYAFQVYMKHLVPSPEQCIGHGQSHFFPFLPVLFFCFWFQFLMHLLLRHHCYKDAGVACSQTIWHVSYISNSMSRRRESRLYV